MDTSFEQTPTHNPSHYIVYMCDLSLMDARYLKGAVPHLPPKSCTISSVCISHRQVGLYLLHCIVYIQGTATMSALDSSTVVVFGVINILGPSASQ